VSLPFQHFDRTYKFIRQAHLDGGRVLVHCKMGISRSASVTISYMMKQYDKDLSDALCHVRGCRDIVKPNTGFRKQLEVYEGMLGAIRHRHTYFGLFRSKSENCLLPEMPGDEAEAKQSAPVGHLVKTLSKVFNRPCSEPIGFIRPKSWSPPEHDNCHCFGELAASCSEASHGKAADMDLDDGLVQSSSAGTSYGRFLEARNPVLMPVNSRLFDPACDCDMEVELRVPASDDHRHTDAVVRSMSTLPLHLRTSEPRSPSSPPRSPPRSPSAPKTMSTPVLPEEDETASKNEELSVKTLANLFDFKVGSVPLRPCSARLEDSQLLKKAKRLSQDSQPQSDC